MRRGPAAADYFLPAFLLAGHCLLLALAGAGIGLRALTMHRKAATMPDALVAADLDLAADVSLHLAAQVTLDLVVGLDPIPQLDDVVICELMHPGVATNASGAERLKRPGPADAVNIGKRDLKPLFARQVYADKACHRGQCSFSICGGPARRPRPCPDAPRPPSGGAPLPAGGWQRIAVRERYSVVARGQCLSPDAACAAGQSR